MSGAAAPFPHPAPRPAWLALHHEEALDPDQRIVDPHHHIWDKLGHRYLIDDFLADLDCGHRIAATIHVQGHFADLTEGPGHLRPIGETRWALAAAEAARGQSASGVIAAIVGFADLAEARVGELLALHAGEAGGLLAGIRQSTVRDPNFPQGVAGSPPPEGLMTHADFQRGFALLEPAGLVFDAWLYSVQLPELAALADRFPHTQIVLDHCGGILGIGAYSGRRDEEFALWKERLTDLARRQNVAVKLGGLGMASTGFGFEARAVPPSSEELATAWRPYIETCIETFGAGRCMFESNFPVDKASTGYGTLWNAFKRIAAGGSAGEKNLLFHGTAERIYRL